jgi:hypothetical protein
VERRDYFMKGEDVGHLVLAMVETVVFRTWRSGTCALAHCRISGLAPHVLLRGQWF